MRRVIYDRAAGQLPLSILIMLTQQFQKTSGRGFRGTILTLWNAVDIIVFISACLEKGAIT